MRAALFIESVSPETITQEMMINLTPEGARILTDITANNIGRNIAIIFEGKIILSARIMTQINNGEIMVSGSFSQKEIDDMVKSISGN